MNNAITWQVYKNPNGSFFFWSPKDHPPKTGIPSTMKEYEEARRQMYTETVKEILQKRFLKE